MPSEKKIRTLATVNAHSFSVNLDEVELVSKRVTNRIRIVHPDASALVPILDDNRILLVKQYRYSIQEETLEIPAGKMDPGETPEECIKREFLEETGYTVEKVQFIISYVPAIGYSSEVLHIFKGTTITKNTSIVDSDEISEIVILTLREIAQKINKKEIKDGKTLLALYILFGDKLETLGAENFIK